MKRTGIALLSIFLPIFAFAACNSGNSTSQNSNPSSSKSESSESGSGAVIVGINNQQFKVVDNILISDNLPIIVDFNATWCPPCQKFSPIFHAVAEKYKGQALFVQIDTDQYPQIAREYKVQSIPTVAFILPGGSVMGYQVGFMPEEQLIDFVNQLVETSAGFDDSY